MLAGPGWDSRLAGHLAQMEKGLPGALLPLSGHLNCLAGVCSFSNAEAFPSLLLLSLVQLDHVQSITLAASCPTPS